MAQVARATIRLMGYRRCGLGVLLALCAFEFGLRHLSYGHQSVDPKVGWEWRSVTVFHRLDEGWGVSHWREDATRDRPAAGRGAPRVLIIGDSFTEALQVDDDEAFSGRLSTVNALNIGRASHSVADYVAFASEYRARYQPQWTVVEVGPTDFAEDAFEPSKTHFDRHLAVIVIPPRFGTISRLLMTLRDHSALIDRGIARWQAYRTAARMPPLFRAADEEAHAGPRASQLAERQWPVAEEMNLLLDAYAHRVTFLFIPPLAPPSTVETQFLQTCTSNHLSCVDARATFADFRSRGDAPFGFPNSRPGVGHMNARGHAAVARLLECELEGIPARGVF